MLDMSSALCEHEFHFELKFNLFIVYAAREQEIHTIVTTAIRLSPS